MQRFVLIGGGNVGRGNTTYDTEIIDKEVVRMTGKTSPNFLFIGLASSFSDSYFDTMKKIYKELGCTPVYLKKKNIINNPSIVEEKINNADIIYVCGGDTIKLLKDIKDYHIDELLKKKDNCIFVGMSAGAILFSNSGYSDSLIIRGESDKFEFIDGLSMVDVNICPHFNDEEREKELRNELDRDVYGIEDSTALIIEDKKIRFVGNGRVTEVNIGD